MKISAFIVCCNEEERLKRCLESVKWCDEIVVVDSGSKDRSVEIAKEYTDSVYHRAWTGYVDQKRFGLEKCSHEWVLNIDADEEVSPELREEIRRVLSSPTEVNGYYLSRVIFYLNRWWRTGTWYPEYRLRLCKKSETEWGGSDPHEKAIVRGKTARLKGELYHYTYSDIFDQVRRLNSHSTDAAASLMKKGARVSYIQILLNPLVRFLKSYFLRLGFREGFPGLLVAVLEAYYVFLKYVKLWELRRIKRASES